jgi:hypothetical protein
MGHPGEEPVQVTARTLFERTIEAWWKNAGPLTGLAVAFNLQILVVGAGVVLLLRPAVAAGILPAWFGGLVPALAAWALLAPAHAGGVASGVAEQVDTTTLEGVFE